MLEVVPSQLDTPGLGPEGNEQPGLLAGAHQTATDRLLRCMVYEEAIRLPVCTVCQFAVLPSELERHLSSSRHGAVPALSRTAAAVFLDRHPDGIDSRTDEHLKNLRDMQPPPPPIVSLKPPQPSGWKCRLCGDCLVNRVSSTDIPLKRLRRHNSVHHASINQDDELANWRSRVPLQQLFPSGTGSAFFEVAFQPGHMQVAPSAALLRTCAAGTAAAITASREVFCQGSFNDGGHCQQSPWLARTGWVEHLQGLSPSFLSELLDLPGLSSPEPLRRSVEALGELVQDAHAVALPAAGHVSQACLFQLYAISATDSPSKPFRPAIKSHTLERYCRIFNKIFSYILRTWDLEHNIGRRWNPTRRQSRAHTALLATMPAVPGETPAAHSQRIREAVLELVITLLDHSLAGRDYDSAILSALAALGRRVSDGGWHQPSTYTGNFAAVLFISRLLVLYLAYSRSKKGQVVPGSLPLPQSTLGVHQPDADNEVDSPVLPAQDSHMFAHDTLSADDESSGPYPHRMGAQHLQLRAQDTPQ
ncbi:unnamed protein product [Clonostachys rosea f. rosea IK726]|uniref:Uncharacterized protein n=4 Tax=Clonostachys rosea f. rosea IK726 TaxID=1349383 RepID=A0ACA9UQV5_BIOOC|nr:unnamed protein product [Clonostachys rosea f. rosea IK726]CAG9955688.1 unnamed protein product [Clonostachys rosea f. rosea IK726]